MGAELTLMGEATSSCGAALVRQSSPRRWRVRLWKVTGLSLGSGKAVGMVRARRLRRSRWDDTPLGRTTAALAAATVGSVATGLLVWSVTTTNANRFAWLTSMSNILAMVFAGWGTAAAVFSSSRGRREAAATHPDSVATNSLPARNPFFIGRDGLLEQINQTLHQRSDTVAVSLQGMGGVGKTQVALEYAYRYGAEYRWVWWVSADDRGLAVRDLVELARRLGLPTGGEPEHTVRGLFAALSAAPGWLLIFDNVDDPTVLAGLRPPGSGKTLLTGRGPGLGRLGVPLRVEEFERADSMALLRGRCPRLNGAEAGRLAEALGDLPLALEQAGCFLAETGADVPGYLTLLAAQPARSGLSDPTADRHPGLAAVVANSLVRLESEAPSAAAFLNQLSVLAPEPLPVKSLASGSQAGVRVGIDDADRILMMRALTGLALVRASGTALQMHRLVHALIRDRMPEPEKTRAMSAAQDLLAAIPGNDPDDPAAWPFHAAMMPHAAALSGRVADDPELSIESPGFRRFVVEIGGYLYYSGRYVEGRDFLAPVYGRWSDILGPDDPDVLAVAQPFANALLGLGAFARAEQISVQSAERCRRVLGPDHQTTMRSVNSLGSALRGLGRYPEARLLHAENLRRRTRLLGAEHRDTLRSASNLAVVLRNLGDYQVACDLDRDTFARRELTLGPDHYETLRSATSLAEDMLGLGDNAAAGKIASAAFQRCARSLGVDHPFTLRAANNYASVMCSLGRFGEASALAADTVVRSEHTLGANHPFTARARKNMARALASSSASSD